MRVKLLYFGILKEKTGRADALVELRDGATVGEMRRILRDRTSNLRTAEAPHARIEDRLWESLAVAVNREYAAPDVVLADGDEVALLPPVSGGAGER